MASAFRPLTHPCRKPIFYQLRHNLQSRVKGFSMVHKPLLTAVLLIALLGTAGVARSVEVGESLAGFSLQDIDGRTHTLAEYRGKVLILLFLGHN